MTRPITVTVGGSRWEHWESMTVQASLEQMSRTFRLNCALDGVAPLPPLGATVAIKHGDDLLATGYVFDRSRSVDASGGASLTISGRSRTAQLVDNSAPVTSWNKTSLLTVASDVAGAYGVAVMSLGIDDAVTELFRQVVAEPGETIADLLLRLAAVRSVLLTDDAGGNLIITRAGDELCYDGLEHPGNVLSMGVDESISDRFASYVVLGQRPSSKRERGLTVLSAYGEASDPLVAINRNWLGVHEDSATKAACDARAAWEAATRLGRGFVVTASVAGLRQSNGDLWAPNRGVAVRSHQLGVDARLLIRDVTYTIDSDEAETTEITLCPRIGFAATNPSEQDADDAQTARSAKIRKRWRWVQ